jgi:hypothetical protein
MDLDDLIKLTETQSEQIVVLFEKNKTFKKIVELQQRQIELLDTQIKRLARHTDMEHE